MYQERLTVYKKIEQMRESKLLVFVTGDRRGMETQIHSEVIPMFVSHLDKIGTTKKISLLLHTQGGDPLAAWSIANLLYQYCDEYEVLIPDKALSAGTLLCLGAKTIVMTQQATLGPIDPTLNSPLNPHPDGYPPTQRIPVSVEAINGYFDLAKGIGISNSEHLANLLSNLTNHVHPVVLGQIYRTRNQTRMLGRRLLNHHSDGDDQIEKILDFLCSESGSHDYMIYRKEAKNDLKLNIEFPDGELYKTIKQIYSIIVADFGLNEPFNYTAVLGDNDEISCKIDRAIIDSVANGSHHFTTVGVIQRNNCPDPTGNIQERVQFNVTKEGWSHEQSPDS